VENKKQAAEELKSFGKKFVTVLSLVEELERLGSLEAIEKEIVARTEETQKQEEKLLLSLEQLKEQRTKLETGIKADLEAAETRAKELVAQAEIRAVELISNSEQILRSAEKKAKEIQEQAEKHLETTRKELAELLTKKQQRTKVLQEIETKITTLKGSIAKV